MGTVRSAYGRYRLASAAPRPAAGFESRWTAVRDVMVHDRTSAPRPDGRALPVVLVHGLAVSHRYLMPLAAGLAVDQPVHVVDLPGFGLSGEPGRTLGLAELADWLADWLTATGVAPAALAGNSFGCQVAVEVAVRHPDLVRCLVLIGPTMDPAARTALRQIGRWLRNLRSEDPLQAAIIARDLLDAGPGRAARTFRIALGDPIEEKLAAIAVPALVTRGGVEPVVPQMWAERAAGLLRRGELAVIPAAPHNSNYTAADRLAPVVLGFLERRTGPAAGR
jgi:pimeloyl-ACP methyl ester carboxylesterase